MKFGVTCMIKKKKSKISLSFFTLFWPNFSLILPDNFLNKTREFNYRKAKKKNMNKN